MPRPFLYKEALAWLYSLQQFGIKLGLENIQRMLAALRVEFGNTRVVHVAGTNGKGSVCAMIDAISRAGNHRTGLFTSPHLVTFRERIRINGEMISEEAVGSGLARIRDLVGNWDPHPTFFEVVTALAAKHFSDGRVDVAVFETGLGGRLDATNALPSNVAVITAVGLDHQKWLGNTVAEIASEKAGIIKSQTPVVSSAQVPEAENVIRQRARECDAPLEIVSTPYTRSPVALRGPHQKENAAVAIAAIGRANIELKESAIARGLAAIEWPARFQCWDERTVIDGAHNPPAAEILAETWREVFGTKRATLILAVLADKDIRAICEALVPIADSVLLPKIRSERAADPQEIAAALSSIAPTLPNASRPRTFITPSFADAFEMARAKPNPILITGSLHFAGEVLAHLQNRPAAFEECAQ